MSLQKRNGVFTVLLLTVFCIGLSGCNTHAFPQPSATVKNPLAEQVNSMVSALEVASLESAKATQANNITQLKQHVRRVHNMIWGTQVTDGHVAPPYPDWKSQWQVSYTEFDPDFAARYGDGAPQFTPGQLGFVGHGRHIRRTLMAHRGNNVTPAVAALNNIIGWMRIDDGVTKAERQPRIDLTYQWDAPNAFWRSTRDTGWVFEVHAQATNILKTRYGKDLASAQAHSADLQALIAKCLEGATDAGEIYPGMRQVASLLLAEAAQ